MAFKTAYNAKAQGILKRIYKWRLSKIAKRFDTQDIVDYDQQHPLSYTAQMNQPNQQEKIWHRHVDANLKGVPVL